MFAKNGFQNVAERVKLGRFVLERFTATDVDRFTAAERMRMSFEELGPTFVKLGQLLATRPDLVPQDFVEEFKKLHDQASTVPFSRIQGVLEEQFGTGLGTVFQYFEEQPLAAASIAQVHRAVLKDGTEVVVKVQRPGIAEIIQDDISILYFLADLLIRYIPESQAYNPYGIVDEFFKSLELETNFIVESNNIRRFQLNFKDDPEVKIPHVYFEYSGRRVLVLETLKGHPLSQKVALQQAGIDPQKVMSVGVRAYFKMVFQHGLFHGDLHAGNLFILPNNQIGLVDFGIVGRLNRRTRDAIASMFVALYSEDYDRLAYEYVELAPYNDRIDVDEFAKDLQALLAPYFGLSMKNVNLGRLLMDSTQVAAKHHLILPSELILFFKSIVTVEGMGRLLADDFDLLSHALEFASVLVKTKYEPGRVKEDLLLLGRDSGALLSTLPRQLKQFVRKVNHPDFAVRLSINEIDDVRKALETSSNIIFLGSVIGCLLIAGSIALSYTRGPVLFELPIASAACYGLAVLLSVLAFTNYFRKI